MGAAAAAVGNRRRFTAVTERLHPEDLERLAELIAERAQPSTRPRLVDAADLARQLSVERSWVYEHANELGAVRLGTGPKAPLRFDPDRALAALASCSADRRSTHAQDPVAEPNRVHRRRRSLGTSVDLLPIRGTSR
jgi:hypothetical protein